MKKNVHDVIITLLLIFSGGNGYYWNLILPIANKNSAMLQDKTVGYSI